MIKVACRCGKKYTAEEQHAGRQTRCSSCGASFRIPAARSVATRPIADGTVDTSNQSPGAVAAPPIAGSNGTEIIGPYLITGFLGKGGMGEVRRARDPSLDREVALKLFPIAIAPNEELLKRFLREAKASARLNHPNVVTVYQIGETAKYVYLAMELVDGGSLETFVARNGPMPWEEATRAIRDAARGLAAAHENGLVHRDIKPGNLLRNRDGTTKVADFGIARVQDAATQLTADASTLGTPLFMSPEQWKRKNVDYRTDIYSLACSYYFLLTGTPPFEAASAPVVGYQHANEPFPNAKELVNSLPDRICTILARGAAKRPSSRFRSAAEFADALDELLESPSKSRGYIRTSDREVPGTFRRALGTIAFLFAVLGTGYGVYRFAVDRGLIGASPIRASRDEISAALPAQAKLNILINGGFEDDFKNGTPPHWSLVAGKWRAVTDHPSLNASERKAFLEVEAGTIGELRQEASVSEFRQLIDARLVRCNTVVYFQCQTPDAFEFVVECRDRNDALIETFSSGQQSGNGRWHRCQFGGDLPNETRVVAARIISRVRRDSGFVDNFVLNFEPREAISQNTKSSVAEPMSNATLNENLLSNSGCEGHWSPSDGIADWTSVSGAWHPSGKQHDLGNQVPEGKFFFSPGYCEFGDLRQEVAVHRLAQHIDANVARCEISAVVSSRADKNPDTCQLLVEFLNHDRVLLDYFLSDEVASAKDWTEIAGERTVPIKTRFVRVTLVSRSQTDNAKNEASFDNVSVVLRAIASSTDR